jgi:KaiC/GvpD/RAD55 family RecA-like ATPase
MTRIILPVLFLFSSCITVNKLSDKLEETHYALYKQKVLFVCSVDSRKVTLINPTHTRYYILRGKRFTERWAPGDTFVIVNNLEDFYDLKFAKDVIPP